ncbi:MAG: sugar phosphate isomerase/epimerase [Acholeplasmataceae bacterium]|jgi:sugar phosphate isomerase/epimerase|nr:sugar phosphate isomerase/epimerase [Acholeplasmataceae bacterium]
MNKIGLQTYTIRKWIKEDKEDAFKKIKDLGIDHIEACRMTLDQETIDLLKKYDIKVTSLQITFRKLKHQKEKVLHFAKSLKIEYLIISVLPLWARIPIIGSSLFSNQVNQLLDFYLKEGFTLGFHHHAYEMKNTTYGIRLDHIFQKMNPSLKLIMDTYWVTLMHQNPLTIYENYHKRIVGIHLRDYGDDTKNTTLGRGSVPFKALFSIIDDKVYLVIEQNTEDPKRAIEEGLRYMEEASERKSV